jgi:two-component system chemotaxis sensor kinase CheA
MINMDNQDPLLEMFIYESSQLLEQLEELVIESEKSGSFDSPAINEVFRIMHTIKGSSAMMSLNSISVLSHSIEDLFYYLREHNDYKADSSLISDLVLSAVDYIKNEITKIKGGNMEEGDCSELLEEIKSYLKDLKGSEPDKAGQIKEAAGSSDISVMPGGSNAASGMNSYKAVIFFQDGCEMENIRAFTVIRNLAEVALDIDYTPRDILENNDTVDIIRREGFSIYFKSYKTYDEMQNFINQTIFLKDLELSILGYEMKEDRVAGRKKEESVHIEQQAAAQSMISVSVSKLDILMDLMGEMVIAEAMVTHNPELDGLELSGLLKAMNQLHKITGEMQDMIMSIRMVPLTATFNKMHRIVRDMCKKLNKKVELILVGEDTEVDKNIIEHISDPLMHLVRNAVDHGIETPEERVGAGKPEKGTIILESKNEGRNVLIMVKDNGRGLNREAILKKARERKLIYKPEEELTDSDIYNMILMPGFSTNDSVSEYSGRGVGMDVVVNNIEAIDGTVSISSTEGRGMTVTIQIPLTLAIIDGMNVAVGNSQYTIPTVSIRESFRPGDGDIIRDPDGNEMIMVRGQCYPILRLHEVFNVDTKIKDLCDGILIMAEQDGKTACLFVDELKGQYQVVVKSLPGYIKKLKKIKGLSGCTLLGDGSISLILDIGSLISMVSASR